MIGRRVATIALVAVCAAGVAGGQAAAAPAKHHKPAPARTYKFVYEDGSYVIKRNGRVIAKGCYSWGLCRRGFLRQLPPLYKTGPGAF